MNYLIIESHPYSGSFNASLATVLEETAREKGHSLKKINLVNDGFDPVMRADDLKNWSNGVSDDALVKQYQSAIKAADILIFPFPVWWGSMPAILKGFCDKVLLFGFAFTYGENGDMIGQLGSKKAIVITTMQTPVDVFNDYFRNPVEGAFIKDTLQTVGIEVLEHFQVDNIASGGRDYAVAKLHELKNAVFNVELGTRDKGQGTRD